MSCASELKPYINNNEDWWKKIRVPKYQKPLTSYHAIIFHMRILFWGFLVLWHPNFFSPILIIIDIRLKFQSTAHLECFKYPYWDMLFLAKIWLFWLQRGQFQYLECQFFFHGSSLLWKWGLSSEAQVIWTFQTCLNWYHISQVQKISFFGFGRG